MYSMTVRLLAQWVVPSSPSPLHLYGMMIRLLAQWVVLSSPSPLHLYGMMVRLLAQWIVPSSPSPLYLSAVCRESSIPQTKSTESAQQIINSGYNNQ